MIALQVAQASSRMLARSEASTIDTGSSAISSLGFSSNARATLMRWRWPPES